MSLEKLDTETRKRQIAEAAFELIALKGIKNLSMAEIAKRVGIVPSAIYRHFSNKDEIVDAVVDLIKESLTGIAKAARKETPDPVDQLKRLVIKHAKFIMDNRSLPRIIFSDGIIDGKHHRRSMIYAAQSAYLAEVADIIKNGQSCGKIKTDLDPAVCAVMFIGIIIPAAIFWHMSGEKFEMMRQIEAAWKIYISAIAA